MTNEELRDGLAGHIVSSVLLELLGRKGIGNALEGIDSDVYSELEGTLTTITSNALASFHKQHNDFARRVREALYAATHNLNGEEIVETDNRIWDAIRMCDEELGNGS